MRGDVLGPNQSFIWPGIFSSLPREKLADTWGSRRRQVYCLVWDQIV